MLHLEEIERRSGLQKDSFSKNYLLPLRPVILTDLSHHWAAHTKWTIDFFKNQYGHLQVPLYSQQVGMPGKSYLQPTTILPLRAYLEQLEKGPLDLRMFLYNIFEHAPELLQDFEMPHITEGFLRRFPFLFFGGQHSRVGLHYDIDLSHVFLNQFHGRKRVVLFAPSQSRAIYQHPFTVASFVDTQRPDFDEYPALRQAKGFECILYPGETLFIPSAYWHSIEYLDGGFSMSLRANESVLRKAKGLLNIASHFVIDRSLNRIWGQGWRDYKTNIAKRRAEMML